MSHGNKKQPKAIRFLFENSIFLIAGALGALLWANFDKDSYDRVVAFDFQSIFASAEDHGTNHAEHHSDSSNAHADTATHEAKHGDEEHESHGDSHDAVAHTGSHSESHSDNHAEDGHHSEHGDAESHAGGHGHGFTLAFLVNDILMALFFAIAGKEVWEALLPGGALSNPRKAATPLLATLGGIVGPVAVYCTGVLMFADWSELGNGWAVPCATDIAFSYLVARIIFGAGHPAIAFLLLLAIADDAAGLIILAVFYPTGELQLSWLLLSVGAVALGFVFQKALRLTSFWWYLLIPGTMSWISFYFAGIHPALGLVPIIPCMPHAGTDLGIFSREERGRADTLNEFEHWWKNPVELVLGMFGLVNAGVAMSSVGAGTWLVLAGLLIGKPAGITLFTWLGQRFLKLEIAGGMTYRHIVTLGMVAGIGFTVALFVSTAAFTPGATLDAVKMGALASFFAAVLAIAGGRMLGIRPVGAELLATEAGAVSLAASTTGGDVTDPVNDGVSA